MQANATGTWIMTRETTEMTRKTTRRTGAMLVRSNYDGAQQEDEGG